jgi:hypothetical protein
MEKSRAAVIRRHLARCSSGETGHVERRVDGSDERASGVEEFSIGHQAARRETKIVAVNIGTMIRVIADYPSALRFVARHDWS